MIRLFYDTSKGENTAFALFKEDFTKRRKIDLFVKVRLTELDKEKFKYLKKLFTQFSQTFQFLNNSRNNSLLRINLAIKNKIYIPLRNFKRANNKYLCISLLNQKFYFAKNSKTNLRRGIQIHKKKKYQSTKFLLHSSIFFSSTKFFYPRSKTGRISRNRFSEILFG